MNLIPLEYRIIFALSLIALGAWASWYVTSDHYQKIIATEHAQQATAVNARLIENQKIAADRAAKITTAETQHAKDQLALNHLHTQLAGVRVHIPDGSCPVPGDTEASANPGGGERVLSNRVDESFAELQAGVDRLTARCDQLNSDARLSNAATQ